jgi:hypothetical protein
VEDGNCPISAFQTFVYATNVLQRTSVGPDQTICGPQIAEIEAQGGLNFVWTIIPGGDPLQVRISPVWIRRSALR